MINSVEETSAADKTSPSLLQVLAQGSTSDCQGIHSQLELDYSSSTQLQSNTSPRERERERERN